MSQPRFYTELPQHHLRVKELLARAELFQQVPADWQVIVTDIKGSTLAVQNGRAELVNLAASGSIIAALNIAAEAQLDIPFFFGGDGATLLVPPQLVAALMTALRLHQQNVSLNFELELRVGKYPVQAVYDHGHELRICRAQTTPLYAIPLVLGNGLQFAESQIKARHTPPVSSVTEAALLNLEGMECRWNKIPPPEDREEVVCLLISAREASAQASVYQQILERAEAIYGNYESRNPISIKRLKLNPRLQKIRQELKMRKPSFGLRVLLKTWIFQLGGKFWWLPSQDGQRYLKELVQLSDIFVLDGRINMIISGTGAQRKQLLNYLDEQEKAGTIIYGFHVARESIISCYVRNRQADHIHFIDGGDGGYTQAAVLLKAKLKR
ncbi:MAG: DUF3095 family protein [Bacteroidota bacterium]